MGDEFFQPKKEVSLLGPGDLGVFVMIFGSEGSSSFVGLPDGCNDIDRWRPSLAGYFVALDGSYSLDSEAWRERCLPRPFPVLLVGNCPLEGERATTGD